MVTPSATAPQLTEGKRHFIFRTIGRDDQQGPAAAQYIINNVKPKKVASCTTSSRTARASHRR
jgi:branched-chain amino acid transport system substrate-binding protein